MGSLVTIKGLNIQTQKLGSQADNIEQDIDRDKEFDAENGLDDFDWSNKADDAPVSLALMATNSEGNPEEDLKDYAIIDSGCSGSMTGDKDKLSDFKEFKGGYVAFGNDSKRNHNFYSQDIRMSYPFSKVQFVDEDLRMKMSMARRLGHVNFKNINKLVKGNLVRGLPSKTFKLDHSCVACRKGKQHRASCKKIEERTVREPLELLHMDLFGPVSVESVNRKKYCLVVTDDCSKFSWVFFLAYKDETYDMLHDLIVGLENRLRHKVKTIRCDHGTEFKNQLMNEFCAKKGIKREYSIARTPQQNGVAERKE
ncbi:putative ribonuclease H-like domain-containing protein [Tanacetum coccineum]